MTFRANKNGTWVGGDDQSAGTTVYGKLGANWLYAKAVFANKNGVWTRAWTDCRKFDESGGRDWSAPTTVVTYSGTCGNRTETTTVTRTKEGCPNDVRATTVGASNCTPECFTPSVNNCDGCGSVTTYTANAGTNCTTYSVGSCGTWDAYVDWESVTTLTIGSFPYAIYNLFFGAWLYTDSTGSTYVSCGGGSGLLGPGGVQKCSLSNTYRATGADVCVF
jgi:hypothetical protein